MDRAEALVQLAATHAQVSALVAGLTPEQLRFRPEENEWSGKEIVAHLRDAADIWGGRLFRTIEEDAPFLPGFDEAALARVRSYYYEHYGMALDAFTFYHERTLTLLRSLDAAGWQRAAQHEELGRITLEDMVARMADHERDHLGQLQRTLAAMRAAQE